MESIRATCVFGHSAMNRPPAEISCTRLYRGSQQPRGEETWHLAEEKRQRGRARATQRTDAENKRQAETDGERRKGKNCEREKPVGQDVRERERWGRGGFRDTDWERDIERWRD